MEFLVTHDLDGFRITSDGANSLQHRPEIHLYGCSVTWGHGLNDSETFAWKLQDSLPQFDVKNYGIGASSNTQALLLFEQNLESGRLPKKVILTYGFFQNMRNTMSWPWRRAFHVFMAQPSYEKEFDRFSVPYAHINSEGELNFRFIQKPDLLETIPGFKWSALAFVINEIYQTFWVDRGLSDFETTLKLLKRFNQECRANGADFLVVGLYGDEETDAMLQALESVNVSVIRTGIDFGDEKMTLNGDGHPNEVASSIIAQQILHHINATATHLD